MEDRKDCTTAGDEPGTTPSLEAGKTEPDDYEMPDPPEIAHAIKHG